MSGNWREAQCPFERVVGAADGFNALAKHHEWRQYWELYEPPVSGPPQLRPVGYYCVFCGQRIPYQEAIDRIYRGEAVPS